MRSTCAITLTGRSLFLTTLILAGCATPYQPRGSSGGYSETRLDTQRFRVEFEGNESTSRDAVYRYLLYRSAELTAEAGYRDFVIMEFRGRPHIYIYNDPTQYRDSSDPVVARYQIKYGATAVIAMSRDEDLAPGSTRLAASEAINVIEGGGTGLGTAVFSATEVRQHLQPMVKR